MSKITAPLLSFGAGGQLANSLVYSSWKGIPYARRYVIPANPRTNRQMVTRSIFKNLQTLWLMMPALGKAPWELNAEGRPYLPVNKFTGTNVKGVDTQTPPTDWSFFIGSPGAKGGLPPMGLALTGGANQITAALTAPDIPDGWSITQAVAIAFKDGDPQAPYAGSVTAAFDASSPYSVVLTGLDAATDYVVSAWFEWERPDGTPAYSTSLTDIEATS